MPWATQEGRSSVEQNSREKLVNMFAEIETSGKHKLIRRQRAGLRRVLALSGEKRCIERHKGVHYLIVGATLYSFDGASTTTLGTLGTTSGRCTMIFNDNDEIMVSDGMSGYLWDGATLTVISTPEGVDTLAYQGGFGIFSVPDSDRFYITAPNDFSSVDALDFATAESYADAIVRVFVDHNEVWLFGVTSTEIWQLSGGSDFPFSPFTNAQLERGCLAPFSVVAEDNTVFWLGDDGVIYRAEGYRPVRASNHAIERLIADLTAEQRVACDAFVYTSEGHKFVTFRFPGGLTVQMNLATGFWNTCESHGYADWRVMGSAGHQTDYYLTEGGICELVRGLSTDEGGIMRRGGVSAPGYADNKRLAIMGLFLDAEVGRSETEINVMMRFAPDGETWGNERVRSLGVIGNYTRHANWTGLGAGRRPTVEFFVTDAGEFSIMAVRVNAKVAAY
jgi:hypothetical protein